MKRKPLPTDVAACHDLIAQLQSQLDQQVATIDQQTADLSSKDSIIAE